VLCPGETITEATIAQIKRLTSSGSDVQGLAENMGLIGVMDKEAAEPAKTGVQG